MISEKKQKFKSENLKIPGKTFLFGEYAVLAGGSCVGLGTSPCFTFVNGAVGQAIHPSSAAGRLLAAQTETQLTMMQSVQMINPYGGGGFGASTAEFLYFYLQLNPEASLQQIFDDYRALYQGSPEQPSGMDVITQLKGKLSSIENQGGRIVHRDCAWPFSEIDFIICSTGLKIQTHDHLSQLNRSLCERLVLPSQSLCHLLQQTDDTLFFAALDQWCRQLEELKLTHSEILNLKAQLKPFFLQKLSFFEIKPCGALGADVVILFYKKSEKEIFKNLFNTLDNNRLKIRADLSQLSPGPLA